MNRRSFFGAAAGAAVAAPALAAEALSPASFQSFGAPWHEIKGSSEYIIGQAAWEPAERVTPWPAAPAQRCNVYVYRTGNPAIDALRSVSGVAKERMEKRLQR